jgi:DNA polymerase III epsilon subunit-like protein
MAKPEVLVSVDIEASGPSPGTGSLIAIGACLVDDPDVEFYGELRPIPGLPWVPSAEAVHGLSREHLAAEGLEPRAAMAAFASWLDEIGPEGSAPVFVGFNAPFDWMFVADYFHRFLGRNPFGVSAMDLKSVYMGRHGVREWARTTKRHVLAVHPVSGIHTHNALDDARMQAQLASALLGRKNAAEGDTES